MNQGVTMNVLESGCYELEWNCGCTGIRLLWQPHVGMSLSFGVTKQSTNPWLQAGPWVM